MNVEDVARITHEANRAYCLALGDTSHVPWDMLSSEMRESVVYGVVNKIANPEVTPSQSHDAWLAFKAVHGWRYGEVKDESKLEHPNMVAYHDLPKHEKLKDVLFGMIVTTFESDVEWDADETGAIHARAAVQISPAVNS